MSFEYEGMRRVQYGEGVFVPVCEKCGRFVKADDTIRFTEGGDGPPEDKPNATCKKCGRMKMVFEGFFEF